MALPIEALVTIPFTKGLESPHLQFLAQLGRTAHFEPGSYILKEDEPADDFYLILQGRVALGTFISGRGFTTIQTIGDNEVLGWSWLIPPHQWRFSALVILPTQVIRFDAQRLREECEADHNFGYAILQRIALVLGKRLEETRNRLEL
ncbi:MAG: cyclic nucleotide-binding domain-containing protein [Anaerolineae bacterium]|nr:cyclic nucleotide-binding domain-containing protein [Anaerolineae bacterium]